MARALHLTSLLVGLTLFVLTSPSNADVVDLHRAAEAGDLPALTSEIDGGTDLDAVQNGWTPLVTASFSGRIGIVDELLKRGADPNFRAPDGATPLAAAILGKHRLIVTLLVDAGADPDLAGADGSTARALAEAEGMSDLLSASKPAMGVAAPSFEIDPLEKRMYITASAANVRSGPGTANAKIATLPNATEVKVTGRDKASGWYRLELADGRTAYVSDTLLGDARPERFVGASAGKMASKPLSAKELENLIYAGKDAVDAIDAGAELGDEKQQWRMVQVSFDFGPDYAKRHLVAFMNAGIRAYAFIGGAGKIVPALYGSDQALGVILEYVRETEPESFSAVGADFAFYAAAYCLPNALKQVLGSGVNPNWSTNNGTPLNYLATAGVIERLNGSNCYETVEVLARAGANLNETTFYKHSLTRWACDRAREEQGKGREVVTGKVEICSALTAGGGRRF